MDLGLTTYLFLGLNCFLLFHFVVILMFVWKIQSLREARQNEFAIKEDAKLFLENAMNEYRSTRGRADYVDNVQRFFRCCGLDDFRFWYNVSDSGVDDGYDDVTKVLWTPPPLPSSCCLSRNESSCLEKDAWKTGCVASVDSKIPNSLFSVRYYASYPVFEVLTLVFGAALAVFIKRTAANSLA